MNNIYAQRIKKRKKKSLFWWLNSWKYEPPLLLETNNRINTVSSSNVFLWTKIQNDVHLSLLFHFMHYFFFRRNDKITQAFPQVITMRFQILYLRGGSKLRCHVFWSSFGMNPRPSATAHWCCSSRSQNPPTYCFQFNLCCVHKVFPQKRIVRCIIILHNLIIWFNN